MLQIHFPRYNYFLCIIHFIKFLKLLNWFDKTTQNVSQVKLSMIIFFCFKLYMYSTNPALSCCLLFTILERDYVNDRNGCFPHIVLCIDWAIEYIIFKVLLRILLYSGCALILFFIWYGHNSLNTIAYAIFTFSSSLLYYFTWFSIFIFHIALKDSLSKCYFAHFFLCFCFCFFKVIFYCYSSVCLLCQHQGRTGVPCSTLVFPGQA